MGLSRVKKCEFLITDPSICKSLDPLEPFKEKRYQKKSIFLISLFQGYCYLKLSNHEKACTVLQDALEIEPDNVEANFRLDKTQNKLGLLHLC